MFLRIAVFYVLTWGSIMLLGGIQQATGILPPQIGLPQLGPGIAALLMLIFFRKDGFKINFTTKDTPPMRYLLAAAIPAGLGLLVYLLSRIIPMETSSLPEVYNQMLLILLWTPLGAIGEEIGWRGYLHKKLDPKMRGLVSSMIVGLLWMPIHVTFLSQPPLIIFLFLIWVISASILIYALVSDTGFNVVLASIFHIAINIINLLVLDVLYSQTYWIVNALVWAAAAAYVVLTNQEKFLAKKV